MIEAGPTYLLIVFGAFVSVLGSFIIFMNSDNENIGKIFDVLVIIVSLAYGVSVYQRGDNSVGKDV